MNIELILHRIEFGGDTSVCLDTVAALQRQFMHKVPFENLDIHLGRPIHLNEHSVFEKVITRRRGGFCFEVNEVFLRLLQGLGFCAVRVASTVLKNGGDAGAPHPFDHETIIVHLNGGRWLCDVGFGHSPFAPLPLDTERVQHDEAGTFRVQKDSGAYRLDWQRQPEQWVSLHRLDPTPRRWQEFAARSAYLQTASDSNFTFKRLCTMPTKNGRVTLSGNHLTVNGRDELFVDESVYGDELKAQFGIVLSSYDWVNPRATKQ